ncbi:hypothetical protein [Amycolatopsis albispora]|uniref:Uncharacterized protein n=1 Tax=Amycolatopsis albispora TaxID=1804986 RepID=A0A344L4D5_9PSEU|nr:hypothetical protein [Amycolatopsis albispora]AXB42909.1 hypothetical protein A4R43_10455 [Amycolatopsis albispora]
MTSLHASPHAPARPASLTAASLLAIGVPVVVIGLTVAACVSMMSWIGGVADGTATRDDGTAFTQAKRESAEAVSPYVLGSFAAVLAVFALLSVLWIVLGLQLRKGSSGARTTLAVFAVLWLLFGLLGAAGGALLLSRVDSYFHDAYTMSIPASLQPLGYAHATVVIVGMIAFLILAYLPASSAYVKATTIARRA